MNAKRFCYLLLLLLMVLLPVYAQQKQEPDQVRDAFLVSRDAKLVSRNDKPAPKATTKKTTRSSRSTDSRALGLGYTVFKKNTDGKPIRVNPEQIFREGDGIRFMVESNEAAYFYIFQTENGGPPKMIFPDARLNGGANRIKAHVPREFPAKDDSGDWWFFFNNTKATERFYLVVSRQPLEGVKTGQTLVAAYQKNPEAHPWQPANALWSELLAQSGKSSLTIGREFGNPQTKTEQLAVVRGVELRPGAPAPSVVRMNTSPKAGLLVAEVALIHQ